MEGKILLERYRQLKHLLEGIHPMQYLAGAFVSITCAFVLFLSFPTGYETSVTGLVNDGHISNIGLIPFTETNPDATNPYYKLRDEIALLTNDKMLPYEVAGKFSVEPGETYQNTLVLKLRSNSQANYQILQGIIRKYNQSYTQHTDTDFSALDDSIMYVARQLENMKSGGQPDTIVQQSPHILDVLDALEYYVKQPVSQFAQLPNTFELNDKNITQLIEEYNSLQNGKQHLLNSGDDVKDDLLKANRQLFEVQQKLNTVIATRRHELQNPEDVKASQEIRQTSKDDLLLLYARLLQTKNSRKAQLQGARMLIINGPVTIRLHTPYFIIVILSLLAGIIAPLAFDRLAAAWKEFSALPDGV